MWSEISITTDMSCSISRIELRVLVADRHGASRQLGALARIEPGGRLIEAEQHRLGAHGAGDFQPALRAIGQFAGRIVGARGQADPVEPIARLVDRGAFRRA